MSEDPIESTTERLLHTNRDVHRECMQVVTEIEACLDRGPGGGQKWLDCLRGKLPELAATLEEHFTEEQAGDLYISLPVKFPRFAERMDRLAAEHPKILETTLSLIDRAGALAGAPMHELREFDGRVQLLVASIRRHEAEENEVVLSALWDEFGVGD